MEAATENLLGGQLPPTTAHPPAAGSTSDLPTLFQRLPVTLETEAKRRSSAVGAWKPVTATLRGHTLVLSAPSTQDSAFDVSSARLLSSRRRDALVIAGIYGESVVLDVGTASTGPWLEALWRVCRSSVSLADFVVRHPIGKGGSGNVFLVTRRSHVPSSRQPHRLALKAIPKHHAFNSDSSLQHCLDERLALELASDHPFIITLRHAFQSEKYLYLVTDFCHRGDMVTGLLNQRPQARLSEREARPLFAQIALALEHLHSRSIVHRDLKLENVLIADDGSIRLADLGLSKVLSTGRFGRTKSFCGTPSSMSPEVVGNSSAYGIAADLWAYGVLLYRCLVGRSPFDLPKGRARSALTKAADEREVFRRIRQEEVYYPPHLSPEASELLVGLLQKNEASRFNLSDVQEAAFFAGVDWEETLENGRIAASTMDACVAGGGTPLSSKVSEESISSLSSTSCDTQAHFNMARLAGVELHDTASTSGDGANAKATCRERASGSKQPSLLNRIASGAGIKAMRKRPSSTSIIGFAYSCMDENDIIQPSSQSILSSHLQDISSSSLNFSGKGEML
jgi:serine/threonine protein kinase